MIAPHKITAEMKQTSIYHDHASLIRGIFSSLLRYFVSVLFETQKI